MFKILVATDGSEGALKAADHAGTLARAIGDAEITVLTVVDTGVIAQASTHPAAMSPTLLEELEEAASEALRDTQQRLTWTGKRVTTCLERGTPAQVICDVAESGRFDLIVMGSRGHGRIAGILLGSVSDKVVHKALVPVTIVRTKEGR